MGPSECSFIAMDTASPYLIEYADGDGNKIAHYMIRWHLKDGSDGGWGETVSATVTA